MKLFIILALSFNLVLNLGRDQEKYKDLIEAGQKTFYQLYNISIDFKDRNMVLINDETKCLRIIVDEYDPLIPDDEFNITFMVINGKPEISDILNSLKELEKNEEVIKASKLSIFGKVFNIKEEFKALANMIAAGFENGKVVIYERIFEDNIQIRYKCFIRSERGEEYGAFEIIQEDKDDAKIIKEIVSKWWNKIINYITEKSNKIQSVCGVVSSFLGIMNQYKEYNKKDPDSSSSLSLFLKSPSLSLPILLALI